MASSGQGPSAGPVTQFRRAFEKGRLGRGRLQPGSLASPQDLQARPGWRKGSPKPPSVGKQQHGSQVQREAGGAGELPEGEEPRAGLPPDNSGQVPHPEGCGACIPEQEGTP